MANQIKRGRKKKREFPQIYWSNGENARQLYKPPPKINEWKEVVEWKKLLFRDENLNNRLSPLLLGQPFFMSSLLFFKCSFKKMADF